MHQIILWMNINRIYVAMALSVMLWVGAYVFYFHRIILNYIRRGGGHNWSIDMVGKKAVSRGKTEIY